jgi:16S rRNA (uracil1498-N3)-methyltransferase
MRHFFIEPSHRDGRRASFSGAEARHIKNVLRLKPGDAVRLFDGSGVEYVGVIDSMPPGKVEVAISGSTPAAGCARLPVSVAQGFLKEKKMDRLVRQISELGAARWMPFISDRSVARPEGGRAQARQERWRRIAVEALKQCRRGDLMQIDEIVGFDRLLERAPAHDLRIIFWEQACAPLTAQRFSGSPAGPASVLIVLGPEGGFAEEEVRAAVAAGFTSASLGPRILRAETAAVAACAIVQHLFGDLGAGAKKS